MSDNMPSALSHVSVGTNDFERAAAFYDAVLKTLGIGRIMEHPGAVGYGRAFPEFWIQSPLDGQSAGAANGSHFAFLARSRQEVDAFWRKALEEGARGEGEPGRRPHYGAPYYGCFLRDLDGHKIEAMIWDETGTG